ncbi:MAG TPA: YbhN family protein [Solirubrobacteraceae bacterium]|nr:YbhN family protein [Solirubrobacteraceae bacterium]
MSALKTKSSPAKKPRSDRRPRIGRQLITLALLAALAVALLAAVPGLRGVVREIRHMSPIWLAIAIALELASDISFVVLFRRFFDRLSGRDARALAWTEQATGALLPGGGAGGLAVGGWLIHLAGAPVDWIVRRSGGVFFLTSAVNGATVILAGLALTLGAGGPHGFTRAGLPALLVAISIAAVAALPLIVRSRPGTPRWIRGISAGVSDAEQSTFRHPSWRLLGSIGYLCFDMAVLWACLAAVGETASVPALVLAYNIGYLANALPVPGGIGVLDAGLAGALVLYGVSPTHAAAAVLVYHAIALWVPGSGGLFAYLRLRPRLLKNRQTHSEDLTGDRQRQYGRARCDRESRSSALASAQR